MTARYDTDLVIAEDEQSWPANRDFDSLVSEASFCNQAFGDEIRRRRFDNDLVIAEEEGSTTEWSPLDILEFWRKASIEWRWSQIALNKT